jgi:hypothetical protein
MRLLPRLGAGTFALCVALLFAGVDVGNAATGDLTWTGQIAASAGTSSTATATWNPSTYYLSLRITTGALSAGRCVTAYFDWSSKGHHDARAVRDCKSADTVTYAFADATPSNIVGGPNKLGVCYAPNDKLGTCVQGHGTHVPRMDWTPWPNVSRATPCDLSWIRRNADGTTSSYIDRHSEKSGLVTYAAC